MGAGLRPRTKAVDEPPNPNVHAPQIYPDCCKISGHPTGAASCIRSSAPRRRRPSARRRGGPGTSHPAKLITNTLHSQPPPAGFFTSRSPVGFGGTAGRHAATTTAGTPGPSRQLPLTAPAAAAAIREMATIPSEMGHSTWMSDPTWTCGKRPWALNAASGGHRRHPICSTGRRPGFAICRILGSSQSGAQSIVYELDTLRHKARHGLEQLSLVFLRELHQQEPNDHY